MERDNLSFYERPERIDSVSIVSVPIEIGSEERGHAKAPRYLLDKGLEKIVTSLGSDIRQVKTIPCPTPSRVEKFGKAKYLEEIAAIARDTAAVVEKAGKRGDTVIALGGDHAMAIGSIAGAANAHSNLGVIYIDAHPDCNTHETTISGNIHGQTTSALMGYGHELLTSVGGKGHSVAPENFLFVGLKDFDPLEIDFLRDTKAKTITMYDITRRGLSPVMLAIDSLRRRVGKVWISMDMDSIDEADAPGTGLPVPSGLTRREVLSIAQHIGKTCDVAGFDIVEIIPEKDKDGKTGQLALEISARFLGGEYSWYQQEYMEAYRQTNMIEETVPQKKRRV